MSSGKLDRCECGWALPAHAGAFDHGVDPQPERQRFGVYVALECPQCGRGHSFICADDPGAFKETRRQRLAAEKRGKQ